MYFDIELDECIILHIRLEWYEHAETALKLHIYCILYCPKSSYIEIHLREDTIWINDAEMILTSYQQISHEGKIPFFLF